MGAGDLYLLSDADRQAIVGMLMKQMRDIQGGIDNLGDPRPYLKDPEMSPEVYIARPYKDTGIPAMNEATREPGSAMCEIFHIQPKKDDEERKIVSSVKVPSAYLPKQIRVYNISLNPTLQEFVIVRRDKFGKWLVDTITLRQGGTVQNNSAVLELTCRVGGGDDPGWVVFPFDDILAATGGTRFFLNPDGTVTLTGDAVIKMSFKMYCTNPGLVQGGFNTDDAFEAQMGYDRGDGAGSVPIPCSYCVGILDDTDKICENMEPKVTGTEKDSFEATATCPMFFFDAKDGDVFDIQVARLAGSNTLTFQSITSSEGCSFWSFEIAG